MACGGLIYAEAAPSLRRFAEATGIPVADTQAGKGGLAWDHPCAVGGVGATGSPAANALAKEADVVLGVGTRYSDFTTASRTAFQHPGVAFINLNIAPFDAGKHAGVSLVADARAGLDALTEAMRGYRVDDGYAARARELAADWQQEVDRAYHLGLQPRPAQTEVLGALNEFARDSDVVVQAAGSMPGQLQMLWRARDPKQYHVEYGYSCMGYEIAGGLGAKLADPERDVLVLVGDGSYLMMAQEIVTAVAERIKLTIILVDNSGFASIGSLSESVGSQRFGTSYRYRDPRTGLLDGDVLPVDLAANAASLGADVLKADTIAEFRAALEQARAAEPDYRDLHPHRPACRRAVIGELVGRPGVGGLRARQHPAGPCRLRGCQAEPAALSVKGDLPRASERERRPPPAARHLPRLMGSMVRRRPAADALVALPRRGRGGGVRVAGTGPVRIPAHQSGAADRRAGPGAGSKAAAGTMHGHSGLHRSADWPDIVGATLRVAELTAALGAQHLIFVPVPGYRDDQTGACTEAAELDPDEWRALVRAVNELGKVILLEHGVRLQFHPHADSHVETQQQTQRFLDETDPRYVSLCLDTGHLAYRHADCAAIIRGYPDRIGYVHIKQMNPAVVAVAERDGLAFGQAVRMGASCEPPGGEPGIEVVTAALRELGTDLFVVVEQDMYPVDFDVPMPIAQRTYRYLRSLGVGEPDAGRDLRQQRGAALTEPSRGAGATRIGVIGTGMIGQDHIRRITQVLSGGSVVAVADVDTSRASAVAAGLQGATAHPTGGELIESGDVDAVLVTSAGPDPCGVRARGDRGGQARLLREAARDHRAGVPADHGCRDGRRPAPGSGRLHAPVRRWLPGAEGGARRRRHRPAAANALRTPQSVSAGDRIYHRDAAQRLGSARDGPGAVAV